MRSSGQHKDREDHPLVNARTERSPPGHYNLLANTRTVKGHLLANTRTERGHFPVNARTELGHFLVNARTERGYLLADRAGSSPGQHKDRTGSSPGQNKDRQGHPLVNTRTDRGHILVNTRTEGGHTQGQRGVNIMADTKADLKTTCPKREFAHAPDPLQRRCWEAENLDQHNCKHVPDCRGSVSCWGW